MSDELAEILSGDANVTGDSSTDNSSTDNDQGNVDTNSDNSNSNADDGNSKTDTNDKTDKSNTDDTNKSTPPVEDKNTQGESGNVPIGALLDERGKRQSAEQRTSELEVELEELKGNKPLPDVFENQEEYTKFLQADTDKKLQVIEQNSLNRFFKMSESQARNRHSDFDTHLDGFKKIAVSRPALIQAMREADDPYEYAYQTHKQFEDLSAIGDVETYRAKTKEEIRAEVLKEIEDEKNQDKETRDALPDSFSNERSTGGEKVAPVDTLEGIFDG